jgi:hypothetical protein
MTDVNANLSIIPIPQHLVDLIWDETKEYLEEAIKTSRGKFTIDDVRQGIDSGIYVLWAVMDGEDVIAAITTRIIEYPNCRAMALDWIGGKRMKEWIGMSNEVMIDHARANNCTHMEGYGRPAWIRWNGKYGWKEDYTSFRLEV